MGRFCRWPLSQFRYRDLPVFPNCLMVIGDDDDDKMTPCPARHHGQEKAEQARTDALEPCGVQ
jgi:hypothetical protein